MANQSYNLSLKKFDLNKIHDDSVVAAIGRRRTGKSILMKDILWHKRFIPFGTVISGTEIANVYYGDFIPKTYIFYEYDKNVVENILKRQADIINKINTKDPRYKNVDSRLFLLLDDCLFDDHWTRDKCIRSIFMNGRHYHILFMVTMQYPLGIPPALRTNIDFTFVMREPYVSNRKKIYEQYAGCFPNFNIFCQTMDSLEQYECLVIDNNSASNKLEDQAFWFKADIREDFKMGSRQFWQYHEENYNTLERNDSRHEEFNMKKFHSNKFNININKI